MDPNDLDESSTLLIDPDEENQSELIENLENEALPWETESESDPDNTYISPSRPSGLLRINRTSGLPERPINDLIALRRKYFEQVMREVMESEKAELKKKKLIEREEKDKYCDNTQSMGRKVFIEIIKAQPLVENEINPSVLAQKNAIGGCLCKMNKLLCAQSDNECTSEDDWTDSD
ncbi:uncharacterized protein LOC119682622 [Teleopsis dalmanni]|uniref:uncharacterized protein LOC119682622 n=1 Tax=Teleopsis dalmanni TaxID=139649 RepID=UPI0018CCDC1D|nr:uncharacterized protein LOC119682622 [Teleopsis dalmanni]